MAVARYIRFARITFFSPPPFRFVVGFIPVRRGDGARAARQTRGRQVSVKIEGYGEAGLYWDLNLINSPERGGAMLNGTARRCSRRRADAPTRLLTAETDGAGVVMPTGVVALSGELAIDIFIARVGLGCAVELLRVTLPGATAAAAAAVAAADGASADRHCWHELYDASRLRAAGDRDWHARRPALHFCRNRLWLVAAVVVAATASLIGVCVCVGRFKKKWEMTVYKWNGPSWEKGTSTHTHTTRTHAHTPPPAAPADGVWQNCCARTAANSALVRRRRRSAVGSRVGGESSGGGAGPCANGWCNFRNGQCVCNKGWFVACRRRRRRRRRRSHRAA